MHVLDTILGKKKRIVLGLMSGTSCDGLDLALMCIDGCGLSGKFEVLRTGHRAYTSVQKKYILSLMDFAHTDVKTVSNANFYLASVWSGMILRFLANAGFRPEEVDLIGSHGQTVYHQPENKQVLGQKIRSTFQIGDPAVLAQHTGITTIGDFRVSDMALGGQAAPLVPYFDWLIYGRLGKSILALNIGGIANITYIPAGAAVQDITAFDTGPGNMLIDQFMARLYELPYDRNGAKAKLGKFSDRLYNYLTKTDPFPAKRPPKSTGREHYGQQFVLDVLRKAVRWRIPEPDVVHTVTVYTAATIQYAWHKFIRHPLDLIVVGGGGSHNKFLLNKLKEQFPGVELKKCSEGGVDADYKEAICFGMLANELLCGNKTNLPQVTGASRPALLGKICPA